MGPRCVRPFRYPLFVQLRVHELLESMEHLHDPLRMPSPFRTRDLHLALCAHSYILRTFEWLSFLPCLQSLFLSKHTRHNRTGCFLPVIDTDWQYRQYWVRRQFEPEAAGGAFRLVGVVQGWVQQRCSLLRVHVRSLQFNLAI